MKIKRAAAQAVIDKVQAGLSIPLGQPPSVIQVPPSQKSQYPAIAILIDSAEFELYNDDEDVQIDESKSPGDDGYELTGFFRTDSDTNDYVVGPTYMLDQGTTISQIGTVRMKGRLWVGARLDPQREQLEQEMAMVFYDSREAPGRLLVSVAGVEIKGVKIPFGIATAMFEDKLQWNSEFAFAERLWTYAPLSIDAPVMVPRFDPIATNLQLLVTQDLETSVEEPPDLLSLENLEQFSVSQSGDVTQI